MASTYAGQPVVFLEHPADNSLGLRYGRWWTAYAGGGSVYLPLVMADSGQQISSGYVDFAAVYSGMIQAELQRPAGADLWSVAARIGDHFRVSVRVRNRSGSAWTTDKNPTLHVLVYEDVRVGVTNTYVRSVDWMPIAPALADGATASFVMETSGISPADWSKVHVIVLADYRPGGSAGPYDILQATRAAMRKPLGDYDGDGLADIAVYRPGDGTWFWLRSMTGNQEFGYRGWGVQAEGDVPVPGDYDGDGIVDPTVYRPSTGSWFVLESSTNYTGWTYFGWGASEDVPLPGDYDGDGRADGAVFRPSTGQWFVRPSATSGVPWNIVFGEAGDTPVPADYDGDGTTDLAVYRASSGTWFILTSSSNFTQWVYRGWGAEAEGDVPAPADYDGDGKVDLAVFRPSTGTWFVLESHSGWNTWNWFGWGNTTDILLPGDYDGDGLADAAVYRPSNGTWYVRPGSGTPPWSIVFGAAGDVPLGGR